jgi:signal transduction histidine kinase
LRARLLAGIGGHARVLSRIGNDLLELARVEAGRLTVQTRVVNLERFLESVEHAWSAEAEARGMHLQVQLPGRPIWIQADPDRLAQAVGNLVENALKYGGRGGRVQVTADVESPTTCALAVHDTGEGIPIDDLPRVFDRYYRVEGRAGSGPGGMGLGLAIARGIALAHGGDLRAEPGAEGGTSFILTLPRASVEAPGEEALARPA